jgi:hypothetical protein
VPVIFLRIKCQVLSRSWNREVLKIYCRLLTRKFNFVGVKVCTAEVKSDHVKLRFKMHLLRLTMLLNVVLCIIFMPIVENSQRRCSSNAKCKLLRYLRMWEKVLQATDFMQLVVMYPHAINFVTIIMVSMKKA